MGYDMHVVDKDGKRIPHSEHSSWQRNTSGGYHQANILVGFGMASWSTQEHPNPPLPPERFSWEYDEATGKDVIVGEGADEYHAAKLAHLRDRFGAPIGIAAHKLCSSNDGWWVTVEECREALEAWEKAGRPPVDDFGHGPLGDTIPFLQLAAQHGGFRVW